MSQDHTAVESIQMEDYSTAWQSEVWSFARESCFLLLGSPTHGDEAPAWPQLGEFSLKMFSWEEPRAEVLENIYHYSTDRKETDLKHLFCETEEEELRKVHPLQDNGGDAELCQDRKEMSGQLHPKYGNSIPSLGGFDFCRYKE